ncbi:MAG: hypothetical protein FJ387_07740 [Verrucomicrobia bacterium]|nr:hypothetical protein [Verrucomicrobiota bacterium]
MSGRVPVPTGSLVCLGRARRARRGRQLARATGWWAALAGVVMAQGQPTSNWRVYRAMDGLRESLTTAITVSPRGNVWLKHGEVEAVSLLDGYSVRHIPAPGERNYRIIENRARRVWSIYDQGLLEYADGQWLRHPIDEVRREHAVNPLRAVRHTPFLPADQDRVFLLFPERLTEYQTARGVLLTLRNAEEASLGRFTDLAAASDGGLWVLGAKGVARVPGPVRQLGPQTVWSEHLLPPTLAVTNLQRPIPDDEGGLTAVGESLTFERRVLVHWDGRQWLTRAVPGENLRFAWRGTEAGEFWAVTLGSLLRIGQEQVEAVREGFTASQFFDAAVQPGGAFWLATREGVVRYAPPCWRRPMPLADLDSVVYSALEEGTNRLWLATARGLVSARRDQAEVFPWPTRFEPVFRARDGLFRLGDGRLAIGAAEGLWTFRPEGASFAAVHHAEGLRAQKVLRQLPGGDLVVQCAEPEGGSGVYRLDRFDGDSFRPWTEAPPPLEVGQELFFLAQARNGDWWLGGSGGPAYWHEDKWHRFTVADGYTDDGAFCWLELEDGRVWCGGLSRILEFDGKRWSVVRAGFDRVSALVRTADGNVWVASGDGLFRFHKESWVAVGQAEGLPSDAVHCLLEDPSGRLWAGTSRGLCQYFPRADIDPPKTVSLSWDQTTDPNGEIVIETLFQGRDKWRYTPDSRLVYSHRLDEGSWSPFDGGGKATFRDLPAGKHRLQVRTMDRNWNVEPVPGLLEFRVVVPWYREPRVMAVSLAGSLAALSFAVLAVNRHLRLRRSYAEVERKVQERTRDLERATQALAHSQKMTALGTLAAGIAHDFNNMLSIIRGSAQIIETHWDDREKVLARVARIKTMVDQAGSIVKAMLGFGLGGRREMVPCQVALVVEETLRLLGDRFQRDLVIRRRLSESLPPVRGIKEHLQQMLLNLVLNAADALAGPGEIEIRAEAVEAAPATAVLPPAAAPGYVLLAVRDAGCGVAPELLPRLFEPFFTTKSLSSRRGTGLGLYMVYQFAKEMGHGLVVESTVGQGSTFTIVLPVAGSPAG